LGGQPGDPGIDAMSWRDRLARREIPKQPLANSANSAKSPPARPIGTIGTIGNGKNTDAAPLPCGWQTHAEPTLRGSRPRADADARTGWGNAEDERAAIVEHDGGAPREWAEGFARLDPDRPPGDVPAQRWLQFVDDIGRFLDSGFAMQAAALGWGPFDLFGCDRGRPFARIDQAGLLWQLTGDRLVALTADAAVIETRDGARRAYCRKPADPNRVLAWELLSR
jgi:hypothetical protein